MSDLVDRHELRLALEREEVIAKRVLGKDHEPLVTAFFEIVYRTLNKASFPSTPEPVVSDEPKVTTAAGAGPMQVDMSKVVPDFSGVTNQALMRADVYEAENLRLRATIAHLRAVIEEAWEWEEGANQKAPGDKSGIIAVDPESFGDLRAILAKAAEEGK